MSADRGRTARREDPFDLVERLAEASPLLAPERAGQPQVGQQAPRQVRKGIARPAAAAAAGGREAEVGPVERASPSRRRGQRGSDGREEGAEAVDVGRQRGQERARRRLPDEKVDRRRRAGVWEEGGGGVWGGRERKGGAGVSRESNPQPKASPTRACWQAMKSRG